MATISIGKFFSYLYYLFFGYLWLEFFQHEIDSLINAEQVFKNQTAVIIRNKEYMVALGLVVTSFIMAWNRYEKILLMREERKKIFLENEKLKKEIYDKETSDSD